MNANELYEKMKEIIGCAELTHDILDAYIHSGGWWKREMLPWEHCAMSFQRIYGSMSKNCLPYDIYLCRYHGKPFFFGLGLNEPEVTDDMLENGTWLVYTWSD